jgi:anaerobic magnesium-protoporphyrin IX monomethyl ester cyclase
MTNYIINPPSPFLINERVFPTLAPLYLATVWGDSEVIDLSGISDWKKETKYLTWEIHPDYDMVVFTGTSAQFHYIYEMNKILKRCGIRTIIGGPHATAISALRNKGIIDINTKRLEKFDVIVEGEGEFFQDSGKKWQKMPIIDITELPIPDRMHYNMPTYKYEINGRKATNIMTQRGCPFNCRFCCGRDIDMYRISRQRNPESVVAEMDYLSDVFGYNAFMWFDDEININPPRLKEFAKLLKNRDYIHRGFVRNDLIVRYPKTLDYLKDCGFVEVCSGAESGSNRMLEAINKHTTYDMNMKAAKMIMRAGFRHKSFLIIGHPGETEGDVNLTKDWIQVANPDDFDITVMTPYPGSQIYDDAVKSKKFKEYLFKYNGLYFNREDFSKGSHFYKGMPGKYVSPVRTDELTAEDIVRLRDEIECLKG